MATSHDSLETFILKKIKHLEKELSMLTTQKDATYIFGGEDCKVYQPNDYWNRFHSLTGQINVLYMCLTGHDNKYDQNQTK